MTKTAFATDELRKLASFSKIAEAQLAVNYPKHNATCLRTGQFIFTMIFSSYRFHEVAALSKRVLLLNAGKLVNTFPPQDLAVELGLRQRYCYRPI